MIIETMQDVINVIRNTVTGYSVDIGKLGESNKAIAVRTTPSGNLYLYNGKRAPQFNFQVLVKAPNHKECLTVITNVTAKLEYIGFDVYVEPSYLEEVNQGVIYNVLFTSYLI